jgi:hypothetical protein
MRLADQISFSIINIETTTGQKITSFVVYYRRDRNESLYIAVPVSFIRCERQNCFVHVEHMTEPAQLIVRHVKGINGRSLTLADLPLPDTKRWVIRRKAEVVAAVRGGLLSLEDACNRYALNADEFISWQNGIDRFGLMGLRATGTKSPRSGRLPGRGG